jgi:hypothetical protein
MSDAPTESRPPASAGAPQPAAVPPGAKPIPGIPGQYPVAAPVGWAQTPNGGWVRMPIYPTAQPMAPTVFQRFWPGPARTLGAPRITISLIVVAAVIGAIGLVPNLPGFGWFVTALALTGLSIATGLARSAAPAEPATPVAVPVEVAKVTETVAEVDTVTDAEVDVMVEVDDEVVVVESEPVPTPAIAHTPVFSLGKHGERVFWGACALALVAVGTFRAAGWLFFWCVVFALVSSAMALTGGRTVRALFAAVWSPVMAPFRSPLWIVRGLRRQRDDGPRIMIAIAISVLLLLVFGGLFASADAEFRHVLGSLLPPLKATEVGRAILCFLIVGVVACGVAFLSAARPKYDEIAPAAARLVRRAEWVLPLSVLNLLFAVFVFIQVKVFFGGDPNLVNASHAYMRGYAHNGFWQLLVVSLLTLTVLLITGRIAPRETQSDRTLLRVLLGGLTVFSIVIVLAALKRVDKYEHAYGFTRLRVVVAGVELWFGLLFVLILIAGITLRAAWLPRVVVGSLVLSLLAGAIANPDRYVAQQNVYRYQNDGRLSISYMQQMSADALPAIDQLPPDLRDCALRTIAQVEHTGDDWRTWNFARVAARNALRDFQAPRASTCPDLVHSRTAR